MRTINKPLGRGLAGVFGAVLIATTFVAPWEGREYVPYYDVGGVLTVCNGHTGADIIKDHVYSDPECDFLLARDVQIAAFAVENTIYTKLPDETKAAFISFTFNVGAGNLKSSTLARLANTGDLVGACNQLSRWVFVKKRVIQGLINRRISERALCLKGLEKTKEV